MFSTVSPSPKATHQKSVSMVYEANTCERPTQIKSGTDPPPKQIYIYIAHDLGWSQICMCVVMYGMTITVREVG
jgi:hypothetical protein